MNFIPQIQGWLLLILSLAALATSLISFLHAAVTKPATFVAADKRTKVFWMAITGGAALLAFLSIPGRGGGSILLTILPIIAGGVYLSDVRPALARYAKRSRGGRGGPGDSGGWRTW